jgi:hypothetical protein
MYLPHLAPAYFLLLSSNPSAGSDSYPTQNPACYNTLLQPRFIASPGGTPHLGVTKIGYITPAGKFQITNPKFQIKSLSMFYCSQTMNS